MVLTPSKMMPLGTQAPSFELFDVVDHKTKTLDSLRGEKGTLVMFICNHCPFVQHIWPKLNDLAADFKKKGITSVAISSNDVVKFPEDAPQHMRSLALENKFPYPYLFDETQKVAKAYNASCTPDFFLFDAHLKCVYRGQFDESRPGNEKPVTGKDLAEAMEALVKGKSIPADQKPSIGCNIKWKV